MLLKPMKNICFQDYAVGNVLHVGDCSEIIETTLISNFVSDEFVWKLVQTLRKLSYN